MWARVRSGALVGALVGVLVAAAFLAGWLERLEVTTLDLRFRQRPVRPPSGEVVVIGITQRCIEELGPTPWPRRNLADGVRELKRVGAAVIGLDIFFPLPTDDPSDDAALAAAMREAGNVILPVFDARRSAGGHVVQFRLNTPRLAAAAWAQGHINVTLDPDGAVRRVPLQVRSTARSFPLFALVAAEHYVARHGTWRAPHSTAMLARSMDTSGQLRINWRPTAGLVPTYTYGDLLHRRIPPERLRGKLVLVGQTAAGLPNADTVVTPYGPRYGVFVQAEVIESILSGSYVQRAPQHLAALATVAFAVLLGALLGALPPRWAVATAIGVLAALTGAAVALFNAAGFIVDAVPLAVATGAALPLTLAQAVARRQREAAQYVHALGALEAAGGEIAALLAPTWSEQDTPYGPLGLDGRFSDSVTLAQAAPRTVLGLIAESVGAEFALFYRAGPAVGEEALPIQYAAPGRGVPAGLLAAATEARGEALDAGRPVLWGGRARRRALRGLHSALAAPVALGRHAGGVLVVLNRRVGGRPAAFSSEDLRVALAALPHLAVCLQSLRVQQQLQSLLRRSARALVAAIEAKDRYTRGHSGRVAAYATQLAEAMGLPAEALEVVELAALVHDVGKIGLSEALLHKPGSLTPEEWALVRAHPRVGSGIFRPLEELSFLAPAIEHHHERFDGGGYPDGLSGTEIPLLARIIGIADAFDAMVSERPYRAAGLSATQAEAELRRCAGTQFDPQLVPLFLEVIGRSGGDRSSDAAAEGTGSEAAPPEERKRRGRAA